MSDSRSKPPATSQTVNPDAEPTREVTALCEHMLTGPYPFDTMLVLDDHLGPTESLIRCRHCGTPYLLEMLDWQADRRLFRVRAPAPAAAEGLLRDLERGSCDLRRAGEEARHVSLTSRRVPVLIMLDTRAAELIATVTGTEAERAPQGSWRELPCDGTLIRSFC